MSTTSSRNFTTLYSGSGSVVPQGAYGNANVVSLLATGTDGANTVGNIEATGTITAGYFVGDGSQLTNITAANITGNVNYANTAGTAQYVTANAQANITSVGTLTSLSVSGNTVGGNLITAGAVSALSVSASGNITGGNLVTSGAVTTTANVVGGNLVTAGQVTANTISSTTISASGNVTGGNLITSGQVSANTISATSISTSGNITAANFFGNIGGNVTAAGSNTQVQFNDSGLIGASAAFTFNKAANALGVSGNVDTTILHNNSIQGTLLAGNLVIRNSFSGTSATSDVLVDARSLLVGSTNNGLGAKAIVQAALNNELHLTTTNAGAPSIYVGKYVSSNPTFTGNVDVVSSSVGGYQGTGNINLSGNVYVSRDGQGANTTFGKANLIVSDSVFVTGNVSATGNITGGNIIGNGQYLSNITGANVSGTVANATYATTSGSATSALTANTVTDAAQANITSVGTLTSLSVSGNITGGNLRTAGAVSATGNINGGNIIVPVNGKYYGDFTTGTVAGRTVFQTTATGTSAATSLTAVPGPNHVVSNTGFSSQINLFANGTDLGNSAFGRMQMFGNRLNFEVLAAGTGPVGNMRFAAGSAQMVFLNTGNAGIGNANPNHSFSTNETYIAGNISVTGNVITSKFLQAQGYTAAALNAITGSIGQIAAVSDSAGGSNPNGMMAFWDTTNARWSYIHDNSAV